jgi:hypothetical protein
MSNAGAKRAVLAALSFGADFSGLRTLPGPESVNGRRLLRWLDRGGLALVLLRRLQTSHVTQSISSEWRDALTQRSGRNTDRTRDMLQEFQRLNDAFRAYGVKAVALKGFTLVPDFCADLSLRHQTDFDFLVPEVSVADAAQALQGCGYSASQLNITGESCFLTPMRHIPSAHDDLYALQRQRQVDLHTSMWEPNPWMHVEVPHDCLEQAQVQTIDGIDFLGLSLADKFILQVLHVFWHSFRSWIRLSWLLEIGRCMELHQDDAALWTSVIERASGSRLTKSIFTFVLRLVTRVFQTPIPAPLQRWTTETTTPTLCAWLDAFAVDWAISDWPGSLTNLLLAAEFIPEPKLRVQYFRSRLLPRKSHTSLGPVAVTGRSMHLRLQAARLSYVVRRTMAHLNDIFGLPAQYLRWRRALNRWSKQTKVVATFIPKGAIGPTQS